MGLFPKVIPLKLFLDHIRFWKSQEDLEMANSVSRIFLTRTVHAAPIHSSRKHRSNARGTCNINPRGVARIFQRGGGHTVSNIIVMAFSPRNIVGCLLKKRLTKGGSRAPQAPPPHYALDSREIRYLESKNNLRGITCGIRPV